LAVFVSVGGIVIGVLILLGSVLLRRPARRARECGAPLFIVFGRLFWAGFYGLGAALVGAGIVGAVVGVGGAGSGAVSAVSGSSWRRASSWPAA
jgi:hypothetical protein